MAIATTRVTGLCIAEKSIAIAIFEYSFPCKNGYDARIS
jgi:hypothetical protein